MHARTFPVLIVVLGLLASPDALSASPVAPFPVRLDGVVDHAAPVAIDLDADGRDDIVVATRTGVFAMRGDGSPLPGFPIDLPAGAVVVTGLAVGALGPPGSSPVVLFGTEDGLLRAYDSAGQPLAGFPHRASAPLGAAPSLVELGGSGELAVVFGTRDGKLVALDRAGRPLSGYPVEVGAAVTTAVSQAPLGQIPVLVFGDDQGRLHAWTAPGRERPGFPYDAHFTIDSQPVLGDVDDDGEFEIAFGSQDYKIHVVEADGTASAGFPVATGYRIYATCSLADLNGDGVVEVLAASGDGKLYAVGRGGQALRGFPVRVGGRLRGGAVVADVDLDGRPEIAVGSDRNGLALLRADGRSYPGFPQRLSERVDVSPLLVDLDVNGQRELVVVARDGSVSAFRLLKKGSAPGRATPWPCEAFDARRSAVSRPNPARYAELKIQPEQPATVDVLRLGYRFFDLDGDPEPATRIRWYRNGQPVAELDGLRAVPAERTRKHEHWHFSLQAAEGEPVFTSPPVEVRNTPPRAPQIVIEPAGARTGDDLHVRVVTEAPDDDGDRVRYRIGWLRDRTPQAGQTRDKVAARLTAKGQRWTAVVTPSDGENDGPPARVAVTVANTAPGAPAVTLTPGRARVTDAIRVQLKRGASDADGDTIRYLYRWWVGETEIGLPPESDMLPAGFAPKGSAVRVQVTSFDGEQAGASAEARAECVNTPPLAPRLAIDPPQPGTGDELVLRVEAPASDPDRDPISYRLSWLREGRLVEGADAARLPAGRARKGERWTVRAVPHDGEVTGEAASAEVRIGNTPPAPPRVEPVEARPTTERDLQVRVVEPARDPDGDPVSVEVVWSEGGSELLRGPERLQLPAEQTRKGRRYLARLVPGDGSASGPQARVWFEVQNSPPGGCELRLAPATPLAGQPLIASLVHPVSDVDGDAVTLRWRWYRDGERLAATGERIEGDQVGCGQQWTVIAVPFDGEVEGPACEIHAEGGNRPPDTPRVQLTPVESRAGMALLAQLEAPARDTDGDPVTVSLDWWVDGRPFDAGRGRLNVPAGVIRAGERWRVCARASDGVARSEETCVEQVVGNSPPGAPQVVIRPELPLSSDDLGCHLVAPTSDPDGEGLQHEFGWFLLSKAGEIPAGTPVASGPLLPVGHTRKGQRWACRASAFDGRERGPAAQAEVVIDNAPPSVPRVELQPSDPDAATALRCVVTGQADDPDGDTVRYRFHWLKDGVEQKFAPETDSVPARLTKANDIWRCSVQATDGQAAGPESEPVEVLIRP